MQKFSIFSGYILNKKTPIVTIKSPLNINIIKEKQTYQEYQKLEKTDNNPYLLYLQLFA